ncbi:MAG: diadenylate cyclase, partial [Solobacterium sp.]|nr:diadenylate cyclase [Solobacterium sp.]
LWGNLSWTLTFADNQKLSYYNGYYHIHVEKQTNTEHTITLLSSVIKDADPEQIRKIDQLIRLAARQRHGTILIIGNPDDISKEAKRISGSGNATAISKISLLEQKHLIAYLTAIDGALLMDTDCNCECIGAILDGDMVTKGSPARGARFNSTVNYVKRRSQLEQNFIGIVVSEDRSVDLVTDNNVYRLTLSN